jgi:KUP system potassium uptake protein
VDFFLGSEQLIVTQRAGMAQWREHLFAFMSRNATTAANYFGIPPERTTIVGMRVEL